MKILIHGVVEDVIVLLIAAGRFLAYLICISIKIILSKSSWATMGLAESLRPIENFWATMERKADYRISDWP